MAGQPRERRRAPTRHRTRQRGETGACSTCQKVRATSAHGCARLARALQNDDGDLPRGPFLVLLEPRHARRLQVVETAPLAALRHARVRLEPFGPDLDGDPGIRAQVPVPVRIRRRAALRCDHEDAVTIPRIRQRVRALLSGLRATRGQQEERAPTEWTGRDLAVMPAEVFDDSLVESVPVTRPTLFAHAEGTEMSRSQFRLRISRSPTRVSQQGFEPWTKRLRVSCSTAELLARCEMVPTGPQHHQPSCPPMLSARVRTSA